MARKLSFDKATLVMSMSGISTKIDKNSLEVETVLQVSNVPATDMVLIQYFADAFVVSLQAQWRKDEVIPTSTTFTWDELVAWTTSPNSRKTLTKEEKRANAKSKLEKEFQLAGIEYTNEQLEKILNKRKM